MTPNLEFNYVKCMTMAVLKKVVVRMGIYVRTERLILNKNRFRCLTLIGKSWNTHPEFFLKFSISRSSHRPFYWKTYPLKIMSTYSVFFQFWGVTQTVLLENSSRRNVTYHSYMVYGFSQKIGQVFQ